MPVIDYTKEDPRDAIPPRSVDFMFDTTGQAMDFLSLMVKSTGSIVSISTTPSGATLQGSSVMRRPDNPRLPLAGRLFLDGMVTVRKLRAWRWGVNYQYLFLEPSGDDLDKIRDFIEEGKLKTVVGERVDLRDIEKVREASLRTYNGKGGLGKTVFEVIRA